MLKPVNKVILPTQADVTYKQVSFVEVDDPENEGFTYSKAQVKEYHPFKSELKQKHLLANQRTLEKQLKAHVKLEPVNPIIMEPDIESALNDFSTLIDE